MITSFTSLPDDSRTWVYQANKVLTSDEQEKVINQMQAFLIQWAAHGKDLKAAAEIRFDRFLIVSVDESANAATGCSIDSSVAFIKNMQQELNLEFFNRAEVAFSINDVIYTEQLNSFKEKVKSGAISDQAMVFNNTITTKAELDTKWKLPLADSWAGRFLPSTV